MNFSTSRSYYDLLWSYCYKLKFIYIYLTIFWDVESGYNEYDKENQLVRIVRLGFPGKKHKILLVYQFKNLKSIKLTIQDGINPKRIIYLWMACDRRWVLSRKAWQGAAARASVSWHALSGE